MYLFSQFACTTVYGPPQKCCVHYITEQQEKGQHLIPECLWDTSPVWQGKSKRLLSFLFLYCAEKQLCEGLFFFFFFWFLITTLFPRCPPLFHVSVPRLPGLWLCIGARVGEAAHTDNLPHSVFSGREPGNVEPCECAERGVGTRYNLQVIFIFEYQ